VLSFQRNIGLVGQAAILPIAALGKYSLFVFETLRRLFFPPVSLKLLLQQITFIGNRSFFIICFAGMLVGGMFGLQTGELMRIFGAESMLGAATGFALSKELAPIVGSLLATGRAGAAMAAQIASMRINEQIDAMRVMAVNPYWYLVVPRVAAAMICMPILTAAFVFCGVCAAFLVAVAFFNVDVGLFFEKLRMIVEIRFVVQGMIKGCAFGFVFATVCCYKGFFARGGAKGVGRATTEAVVISFVTILVSNFFLSYTQSDTE